MSIKEIFCQDKAISILQRSYISGKMPHAYIFAGSEGVGKFATARQWAKILLCKEPTVENDFADSCGQCESCRLIEADSHSDFNHVYKELIQFTKDGKNKKTPVDLPKDVIREFLIDKVSARPNVSSRRVFVVSEAEKLNAASQNSLLKVLEEPPGYCSIILLCARLEMMLATTKSRCRIIRFGPIDEERIIEKLLETSIGPDQRRYFARLAQGSIGRAMQWANLQVGDANLYETKKKLIDLLTRCDYARSLDLAEWMGDQAKKIAGVWSSLEKETSKTDINRRAQKTLVLMLISALHDAMKLGVSGEDNIVNFDQKQAIATLSSRFSPELAGEKIDLAYRAMQWIDSSVNEKLIFERLLLNLNDSDKIAT